MANVLIMPFIDESESFTNGFECGQVWQVLHDGGTFEKYLIHLANERQIIKIAATFGLSCQIEIADKEWGYLTVKDTPLDFLK